MNSWVFSRLIAENERAGESLSREMDAVAQAEREQGRSLHSICCFPPIVGSSFGTRILRSEASHFFYLHSVFGTSSLLLGTHAYYHFIWFVAERMRVQLESCVSNIRAALATLSRAVM